MRSSSLRESAPPLLLHTWKRLVVVPATGPNVSFVPLNVVPGVLATAVVIAETTFVV
ncbi:MAG: hypothetical protein R3C17_20935 [Planctomycetaceae bacterium]